jgi:YVTN family beta-propeller protein
MIRCLSFGGFQRDAASFFTLSAFWAVHSHAAEPDKKTAIALISGEASVSLIDMASRSVYQTFYVGKEPHHLLLTPDQKAVLVANAAGNDIVFLDPKTGEMIRRVPNIIAPYHIGYSPDKKWFIAAGNRLDRIDIYVADDQELKLVKVIKAPKTPSHIAFTNDSKTAFVTLQDSDELIAIDLIDMEKLEKVADITGLPSGPDCMDMTPDGKELWVTFRFSKKVGVIDIPSRKLVATIPVGKSPHGIFFHPNAPWE